MTFEKSIKYRYSSQSHIIFFSPHFYCEPTDASWTHMTAGEGPIIQLTSMALALLSIHLFESQISEYASRLHDETSQTKRIIHTHTRFFSPPAQRLSAHFRLRGTQQARGHTTAHVGVSFDARGVSFRRKSRSHWLHFAGLLFRRSRTIVGS